MMLPWQKRPLALNSPRDLPGLALWLDSKDVSSLRNDAGAQPVTTDGIKLASDKSGNSSVNVLCLNGVASNNASAPDSVPLSITGDVRLEWYGALVSWASGSRQVVLSKYNSTGNQRGYWLAVTATGALEVIQSTDGTATAAFTSSTTLGLSAFAAKWIRATLDVDNGAAGRTCTFETSDDGVTWSALGTAQTVATAANTFDSTAVLNVGGNDAGAYNIPVGIVYRARIYSTPLGTPTLQFDANFSLAAKLAPSFTESSSNAATVTINTSGATGARISGARDLYQGTAANQPVYLPWSGTNYGYLNNIAGNYYSAPDAGDITGDIGIFGRVSAKDWTPSGDRVVAAKWLAAGNQRGAILAINATGNLKLYWSNDGSATLSTESTTTLPFANDATGWVYATMDVDDGAGNRVIKFYYAADTGNNTEPTWTQLGTTVTTAGTTSIFDNTALWAAGAHSNGANSVWDGNIYYAAFRNGYDGAGSIVKSFTPSAYTTGTTFTASTGEVWTINGGATIVTRTCLYWDGSNDYLKAAAFSLSQPETVYFVGSQVSWTDADCFYAGNVNGAAVLAQNTTTPNIAAYSGTFTTNNAGLSVGTNGVITAVFNNASSLTRVNRSAAVTGTTGATGSGGFTLAANGNGSTGFANITAQEVLVYSGAHDKATQDRVIAYLANRNRIALT